VKRIKGVIIFIATLCASGAWAQECTVTASPVDFGAYDVSAGSPLAAVGSIGVVCTSRTPSTVKLDPGRNSGGSFNPRRMSGAGSYLGYNLYTDAGCTSIWGDGTAGTFTRAGGRNLAVYGCIPARQKVKPGTYGDVVTFIVEW
jgi:spore coat protein U-like protein